jgi:putative hemolysin
MSFLEIFICAVLLATSACLAASEIALFSLSRFQLRALKDVDRVPYKKIKRLLADPGGLLVTLLVLNEIVNVALSAFMASIISRDDGPKLWAAAHFPSVPGWAVDTAMGVLITTPLLLLLGEVTPKVIAARANELIAPLTARPLTAIYDALKPVRLTLRWIVDFVSRRARLPGDRSPAGENSDDQHLLKESDFIMMVEEGQREGALNPGEVELIKNVFDLDDTTVAEIATPLAQVQSLSELTTVKTALQSIRAHKYSRIPVVTANRKDIVGVLYSKDLLKARLEPEMLNLTVKALMRRPVSVGANVRLNSLFRKMMQQKTHMAVVVGESGPVGIVTMSDVLESLFEDVLPESPADFED